MGVFTLVVLVFEPDHVLPLTWQDVEGSHDEFWFKSCLLSQLFES
ncbi:hypothetical protein L861_14840 [Litchfieldella anticariensis FP35 = DSM 16096]|uniref:Uncharacterized protein n=1 Tax=Litchfieldella anticariensis (strain DSM 16096 / CECT 5854 / CIP 108499 / LMG 22089 / FP35) TaxID=1121939 RepID=S2KK33_LITA3|nr:hypothetical protein L861_14840 [Halomonas anticariensis FP35 = DSM 16096]